MIDLLSLPGLEPVDLDNEESGRLTITTKVIADALTECPKCGGALYRHGTKKNLYADTPVQMKPVRIKAECPRYRCRACKTISSPELD